MGFVSNKKVKKTGVSCDNAREAREKKRWRLLLVLPVQLAKEKHISDDLM